MTKKELHHLCHANGVPPKVYKWSVKELDNEYLANKLVPMWIDMEAFINNHRCLYFFFEKNPILAAQLAATFLKKAYSDGYLLSRWTNPTIIADFKAESWDNGNAYEELLVADFLVIDKVGIKLDDFKSKTFETFTEDRLLAERSTVFVGACDALSSFSSRIIYMLRDMDAIEVHEKNSIKIS